MFERNIKLLRLKLKEKDRVICSGLPGASKSFLLKKIREELKKTILLIVPSNEFGEKINEDLMRFGLKSHFLPHWDSNPFEPSSPSSLIQYERVETLYKVLSSNFDVLITTPISLAQKVLSPDEIISNSIEIKVNHEIKYSELPQKLTDLGYRRVEAEPDEGEFSLAGDRLEIVFPDSKRLIVELFGNTVELIELNREKVEEFAILPALEMIPDRKRLSKIEKKFPELIEKHLILGEISGAEKLLPEVYELTSILDYIKDPITVAIEPFQCKALLEEFKRNLNIDFQMLIKERIPSSDPEKFFSFKDFEYKIGITDSTASSDINFEIEPLPPIDDENYRELIKQNENNEIKVVITSDYLKHEITKLSENLGIDISIEKGKSSGSFWFKEKKLAFLTESEVRLVTKGKDILSINQGELIVHRDYGIGKFIGITNRELAGKKFDFIEIEYANGEKLFAPFIQIDRIYRYSGFKGKKPKLDRLGGTSWRNLERKVKASLINFARELAQLYKERKSLKGKSIIGDRELIERFEKAFPHKETPDQLKAIRDVYKDMESDKPMDRLICGDVGFGKTEIAMRAAMKAVSAGKQVALLAPTTILAEQHYRTFKKRFKEFPVKIEMLSRFVNKKQQRRILEELKSGDVDIIIGTHRITSDDVKFKDLGLLIIDEEHRFGVKTKEKITAMKKNLDVLYMSATPIPRTLYSSLSGFRSISLIETPPQGRKGTKVAVMRYSDKNLKLAIERELSRNGQVFIVQNDISELENLKETVQKHFPEANINIVHGKMKAERIEDVMHKFVNGSTNVLIATSIVESGLDIPSANTLIVIGAENFGLSQLYQLKGRVGRGVERGYCYLFTSPKARITPEAAKRLEAMKNLSPLGGGFQLALKDLEIRGAGNLLGPQQSGYINSIGFDLYIKMFEEVVSENEERDIRVNLPFEAFIPEDYISDTKERLRIYSEISNETSDQILKKIEEIHGVIPDPLINMFNTMKIKKIARELGIEEVTLTESGKLILTFVESPNVPPEKIVKLVKETKATFTPDRKLYSTANTLEEVVSFLESLKGKHCEQES